MKIFLDTNVLASAFATRGLCEDVLKEILLSHELIIAEPLLNELEMVLIKKFKVPALLVKETISFLREATRILHRQNFSPGNQDTKKLIHYLLLTLFPKFVLPLFLEQTQHRQGKLHSR